MRIPGVIIAYSDIEFMSFRLSVHVYRILRWYSAKNHIMFSFFIICLFIFFKDFMNWFFAQNNTNIIFANSAVKKKKFYRNVVALILMVNVSKFHSFVWIFLMNIFCEFTKINFLVSVIIWPISFWREKLKKYSH